MTAYKKKKGILDLTNGPIINRNDQRKLKEADKVNKQINNLEQELNNVEGNNRKTEEKRRELTNKIYYKKT